MEEKKFCRQCNCDRECTQQSAVDGKQYRTANITCNECGSVVDGVYLSAAQQTVEV